MDGPTTGGQELAHGAASLDLVATEPVTTATGRWTTPGLGHPGTAPAAAGSALAPVRASLATAAPGPGIPTGAAPSRRSRS